MRNLAFAALVLATITVPLASTSTADHKTKQVRFRGIHPIPRSEGGGVCHIEGPHVHIFAADKLQYREHDGANFFVGDPVAYGWDGPKHAYKGHHPIHVDGDVEFCYLDGPHFHDFAAPEGPEFELRGDVAFYVGEPPPVYVEERPAFVKINAVYSPLRYERPLVTVEAPGAWIGVRYPVVVVPVAPVVVAPRAEVDVIVPVPSVRIDVGVGVGFGVGIGGGGHFEKGHHDNGRHRGRHK